MTQLKILNDFAFQKVLGEKGAEPQLLAFLNAVLARTGKGNLVSVEIIADKDLPAERAREKSGRLDVLARLSDGSRVNIEVQLRDQRNIVQRTLFYWARKYVEGFSAGEDYRKLLPVICINILGFELDPEDEDYHTSYRLREEQNKDKLLTDLIEIHFLDMVKFRKSKDRNLDDPLIRWLTFFDEKSSKERIEEVVKMDDELKLVKEKLDWLNANPSLVRRYQSIEDAERDKISELNAAREEGLEEGLEKGIQETARKFKAMGIPLEQIMQGTGLSAEQINEL